MTPDNRDSAHTRTYATADQGHKTQARVEAFRAAVRLHAIGHKEGSIHRNFPMAVSVHALPASQLAFESEATAKTSGPSGAAQKTASSGFVRHAILGMALMASGAWMNSEAPIAQDVSAQTNLADAPNELAEQRTLDSTEFVMANDLSKFSAAEVRRQLRYISVKLKGIEQQTLDVPSRLLLSKWASDTNALSTVGLNWKVLYGFIHAESTWIAQEGMGKNGVKSHGLAQFEPATAKIYGLANAYDPLAAVSAAAALIKDAALWTRTRLVKRPLQLANAAQAEQALNDGVSVAYNTGWKTRHTWMPENVQSLPAATQTHIINVKAGVLIADNLESGVKAGKNLDTPSSELCQSPRPKGRGLSRKAQAG